jgi:tricorn protease
MGGDICSLDLASGRDRRIAIEWRSPRVQTQRRFSSATRHLDDYHLHPKGHAITLASRGKIFSMAHWEGAAVQYGVREGARHRLPHWLHDGKRLVAVSDQDHGEEKLVVFSGEPEAEPERVFLAPSGRVQTLVTSPAAALAAVTTSRLELWLVNLESGENRRLDRNEFAEIAGVAFSPDGQWLAYRKRISTAQGAIFLCSLQSGEVRRVTKPVLYDIQPHFDPEGRYLYFLSGRVLNPYNDLIQFAVSFPGPMKPYLITLRKELPNPFLPLPAAPGEESAALKNGHSNGEKNSEADGGAEKAEAKDKAPEPLRIDWEGIEHRVVEFPVKEGIYRQVIGIKDKVVFTSFPLHGRADLGDTSAWEEDDERGTLWVYDFGNQKLETLASDVSSSVQVANAGKTLSYRSGRRIRVLKAGEKPAESGEAATRKTGWLDLGRVKYALDPRLEWRQMFREAWRLQREFFWNEKMSGVDWQRVYDRYCPLLERVATRSEFSDLIWELQGELGTSHAYEIGGDYRAAPYHSIGRLGADLDFEPVSQRYLFSKIYRGDVWLKDHSSPLCGPGLNLKEGDALLAIGGVRLNANVTPGQVLANQAGQEVVLTVQAPHEAAPRHVTIKTLHSEYALRYREWVERNCRRVEEASHGRIGYLHVPDMKTNGLIEFHRYYLAQTNKPGLIVDVRYNGGGNVSFLLLEKLIRRPLGYDVKRWGAPVPYPQHSLRGPIVALTNEFAGSDGDIFCHSFKFLKVGPLIGKRTWGGVIGIDNRYYLADGGRTTQPQYSFWFSDVQWQVENYGVDPDIEVDCDPGAHLRGEDPQLERGIAEALRLLEEQGEELPAFEGMPHLPLPS